MYSKVIEFIYSYNFEELSELSKAYILSFASEEKGKASKSCNSRVLTKNYEAAPATTFGIPAATSKAPETIADTRGTTANNDASGTTPNTAQTNSNVFETTSQALGTSSNGARPTYIAHETTSKAPETIADTRGTIVNKSPMGRFYIRTHRKY
uniref:Uncharacterized protein n=1 Tax=Panagrolaimus sp. PS1159 TaxID=55785 RepID=A0AC35GK89_9BILA